MTASTRIGGAPARPGLDKGLLFLACLTPLLACAGGMLRTSGLPWVPGFNLGADPVRFVLDTFGKSALNLLLLTLLITPLRWLSGCNSLLRLRRMLGLFAFGYALLHFLTYLGPYQGLSWTEISKDLAKRPFTAAGFIALLLLLPLALTSTDRMMRRLKARWTQLHRLIYLIAPLTALHFWKMLKHEYREPLLYAGLLALLLGLRLVRRGQQRRRAAATTRAALPSGALRSRSEPPRAPERASAAAPWPDS